MNNTFFCFLAHRVLVIYFTIFPLKNIILYEYPCRLDAMYSDVWCNRCLAMYGVTQSNESMAIVNPFCGGHCSALYNPDRAPLKEVLRGQYNYREGGRQVLWQGA